MRNKGMVRLLGVTGALAIAAVSVGCGRSDSNNSSEGGGGGGGGSNVATEVKTGEGVTGTTITIGGIVPTTGPVAAFAKPLTNGLDAYIGSLNAKGGIKGKYQVKMQYFDSKYEAPTGVQAYQSNKAKVAMFAPVFGTAVVQAVNEQLKSDDILGAPASQDAFWVREPNLLPIGAPYQIQAINGLQYAVDKLDAKSKKVCALTKTDGYGEAGKAGYDYAIEKLGIKSAGASVYQPNPPNFTQQISELKGYGCDIVYLTAITETAAIITAAAQAKFEPKWLAASPAWNASYATNADLAPYLEKNFLLVAEGPRWGDTSVPGMKAAMDDLQKYTKDQTPNGFFLFGYAQGYAIQAALEQAVESGDLTPKGIVEASHKLGKVTFGGLYGDYTYGDPGDRNPPRENVIFKVVPSIPNGLDVVQKVASPHAESYEFTAK